MKTTNLLVIGIAVVFLSCDKEEKAGLQFRIDSLSTALNESKKTEIAMNEVGAMLDSIDASRHMLHSKITEGLSYADYIQRLKDINSHIKDSQAKLSELESNLQKTKNISLITINRLKKDLDARSKEIGALQMDVVNLRDKNNGLISEGVKRDSVASSQYEIIKLKNENVAKLEKAAQETSSQNRIKVADLYFAQAAALETAADRTKFAPRKKRETRREALELYKLSFSLGKSEAEARIEKLEKELS